MIVSVDDAEIHFTARGQGRLCLVLTGIGTRPYELQMPAALGERLRLAFVDLRGGGRSTGDPVDLTFDRLAADLDAVRTALGVRRMTVLGHSVLGALAIEVGRRSPETVSHVITVGTPPIGDMARVGPAAELFFAEDASAERRRILSDNLAALPDDAPPGLRMYAETPKRFFDPRLDARPLFAGAEPRPALLQHLFATLLPSWDVTAGADSLAVPILLAHGRFDYIVPYRMWDGLVERLPNATFHLFERSSHHPFVDEPEEFVRVVGTWMASSAPS